MAVYGGKINKDVNVFSDGDHTYSVTRFSSAGFSTATSDNPAQRHDLKIDVVSSKSSDGLAPDSTDARGVESNSYNRSLGNNSYPGRSVYTSNQGDDGNFSQANYGDSLYYGRLPGTDQRSAFVSKVGMRDAKPPPIPSSMVAGNVGLAASTNYPPGSVLWQGVRSMSPVGVPSSDGSVLIGSTRYPTSQAALVNPSAQGKPHQINIQYQMAYNPDPTAPGGNSSPHSSVGSGGDSKNSSPRASVTNPAFFEQKAWNAGSFDSRYTGAQDQIPVQRIVGSSEHDSTTRSYPSVSQSVISLGPRGDSRFSEHIYTDPRQRTLPPQMAASVHTTTYATNVGGRIVKSTANDGSHVNVSSLSPASRNSNNQHNLENHNASPSVPVRIPVNTVHEAKNSNLDAEKAVAALTQQLERDMSISSSSSRRGPDSPHNNGQIEPPPPYHGPHDVQTSAKYPPGVAQPQKPNIRLVAPVQGIQVQTGPSSPLTRSVKSPGMKSHLAFQVTPPKPKGPSDAERKLAALTQQLEDEMDQVAAGDYFGEKLFFFFSVL